MGETETSSAKVSGETGMNEGSVKSSPVKPKPSWFTPKRLLAIFCVINLINYVDRGAIASNGVNGSPKICPKSGACTAGSGIQGDFNLNNFEDGVISSAFMVGLLVASPVFAALAKSVNPFRLIGVGLSVWTLATTGCGFSFNFWSLAVCRMLVGVGEASFISLAAPFIDDNAPAAQKTAWLGIFYMCIPSGIALGYVYGGQVGGHLNWRAAFWGEAILMFPFAIFGLVVKPLILKGFSHGGSEKTLTSVEPAASEDQDNQDRVLPSEELRDQTSNEAPNSSCANNNLDRLRRLGKDIKEILLEKIYLVNVVGYVVYNFVVGAYSYWGPKAVYSIYNLNNADTIFGAITIVCGILGTLGGGFALDRMTSTISNAFKLLSATTFLGAIFCFGAFCLKSLYGFLVLFAIGELFIFATQGPVNFVCLHCINPSLRPLSMALSTVSIHIFGDVPSSPLVGAVQDRINDWRKTALILTAILFLASVIWLIGIFLHSVDRFNEDTGVPATTSDRSNIRPSLEENTGTAQHNLRGILDG